MSECECLPKCPFFNDMMPNKPATSESMKKRYCLEDNSQCARFVVFTTLGREKVPANLFPNQMDKALSIIG